jgi:hypothetical protein
MFSHEDAAADVERAAIPLTSSLIRPGKTSGSNTKGKLFNHFQEFSDLYIGLGVAVLFLGLGFVISARSAGPQPGRMGVLGHFFCGTGRLLHSGAVRSMAFKHCMGTTETPTGVS